MDEKKLSNRNLAIYAVKEAVYLSILPVLWGTITHQFLLFRGVSPGLVGVYTTLTTGAQVVTNILLSTTAERVKNPLRFCTLLIALLTAVSLLLLPVAFWDLGNIATFAVVCALSLLQLAFHSCKVICDFKINYQIILPEKYGTMVFLCNALCGFAGIAFSAAFSAMIDANTAGNPYFICMLMTIGVLLLTLLLNSLLKPLHPVPTPKKAAPNLFQQFKVLMKLPYFRNLIIPNMLRGITLSVTGCIVLIALVMGIDESGRAKIPLICALATACSSALYILLSKKLSVGVINIIGSVLLCAMLFMPRGNSFWFLTLYFVAHTGRMLVDNAIPTMLFPIVDPAIAGSYNAWRSVLYCLASMLFTPVVSALVEKVDPLWLLTPAVVSYLIVTVWYYIACKKYTGSR